MSLLEQRQIKILWIIFIFVLIPGLLWQLGVKFQQFFFSAFHLPDKYRVNAFFDDRD